ncbi:MAG: NIPSNAP family protein [Verrucomicrobia bacterium]|nr:NIPSNAP family protein [Verrucomicrobiota bacterium]
MNRRHFLKTSLATTTLAGLGSALAAEAGHGKREFFELRAFTLRPDKQPVADDYLSKAFIPAMNRLGVRPIGVFHDAPELNPPPKTPPATPPLPTAPLYVLIRYTSLDQIATVATRLAADAEYQKAGEAYLRAPATDPVYDRIESSVLLAFEGMPALDAPPKGDRIFQLRIYESCGEAAGKKKIEMFNSAGEIAIFRRCGLKPVFFGETIAGLRMPNLTYMLTFPDDDARKAAWDKFRSDPDWLRLRAMPEYADKAIVSKITNRVLKPAPYSQI